MIKLISKKEIDGIHEQVWLFALYHTPLPTVFFHEARYPSEIDCDVDCRLERGEVIVSAVGKYISLETSNGLEKDQLQTEAINRLEDMYKYIRDRTGHIKQNCGFILKLDDLMLRIARPGKQYHLYNTIIQMCNEQIEYENSLQTI